MRAAFYPRYAVRSLRRGGQRTLLALFCVAVGVMAIVGLQLVGGMIEDALVGNARVINGGDVAVRATTSPLTAGDLAVFADLQRQGVIDAYTATYETGTQLPRPNGRRALVDLRAVDPAAFPLVGTPTLKRSTGGDFRAILSAPGGAVVSQSLFDALGGDLGRTMRVTAGPDGRQFDVHIAGVLDPHSPIAQGRTLFISLDTFRRASPAPFGYTAVFTTTPDQARADQAEQIIRQRLPLATTETASALLKQLSDQVQLLNRFLVIVGLLALLIGGVGIVNTMQVLLSRRRVEIAMLKTTGYLRRDLALLFGLEAGLLGLLGGALGAVAGIGVAAAIRALFERAFQLALTFRVDPGVIAGGVAVGLVTALIFGLLPIVQAAGIRPQAVLRELPEGGGRGGALQAAGLIVLLSALFTVLASVIIGSVVWGLAAVYGTFVVLALLALVFGAVVYTIGRLPVPERYSVPFVALVTAAAAIAGALAYFVPSLRGVALLALAAILCGYLIVLAPPAWRISAKMAFRNLGRTRARTTTTLLALFIGIFAVGLVLVLGQGIRGTVSSFLAKQTRYNVIALVPRAEAAAFDQALDKAPGIRQREANDVAIGIQPLTINGQPIGALLGHSREFADDQISSQLAARLLSGVQGYDLAHGQLPQVAEITAGRMLTAADAGTSNVILDDNLRKKPLSLQPGATIEVLNQFTGQRRTLTAVGFYTMSTTGISLNLNAAPMLGPAALAQAIGGAGTQTVFYLAVDPARTGDVTDLLTQAVPRAQVLNFADLLAQFGQVLNNLLLMLTAIASLALVAGVIIIANAVALAMLERRRELGILKAVGYTSRRVLGITLIENGLVGGLGGLLGMALVALATAIFNWQGNIDFGVNPWLAVGLVLLVAAVALLTAALVAWGAARVRPLEVLRYE
ncbi:MAG TPA: FtsX-like permease family protein [Thermomicrobiales bacterium]|nr:FtsX-like permease family protein [Thermomicrobiales bacterium]